MITRRVFCVFDLAWSPDGGRVVIGGTGKTVRILDAATLATNLVCRGGAAMTSKVTWSPDARFIAAASADNAVHVWHADGAPAITLPLRLAHAVAWSPGGELLAASSYHKTIDLWETRTWMRVHHISGGAAALAWSPDGRYLAAGHPGEVSILDVETGRAEQRLACRALKYALALAWSPDGGRLAVGGNNPEAVEVWNVLSPECIDAPHVTYRGHTSYIWSVAWAPDGRCIASASWGQVHLWDSTTGCLLATHSSHKENVYCVAWSPDGTRLASGGRDRTIQIWSVNEAISCAGASLGRH